jgi:glycosyltransferase involved in cell wall biosynthesis
MVGDKQLERDIVIIYSNIELVNGGSAGSARVMNYARAISKNCNVILLTFIRRKEIKFESIKEVETGIYTVGIKGKENRFLSKFFYVFYVLSFLFEISKFSKKFDGRIKSFLLYPSTKILLDILTIIYLIKIKKFNVFYEVNEVRKYSSNLLYNKDLYSAFKRLLYGFSEKLSGYFTGLLCISTNIENYFKKYNDKTVRIPILSNIKIVPELRHKKLADNDVFKIGFFGSVSYKKENFDLFFRSLLLLRQKCPDRKFTVALYGQISSETEELLPEKLKEYNLEGVIKYFGKIDQNSVLSIMKNYHLLVLPRGNNLQNKFGFSTKLSEYLISGVPVLVTDVSDNALYLKDGFNGFVVPPDNINALTEKICYIINNYNYFKNIEKNAFDTVKSHFAYNIYSDMLKDLLCGKE